MVRANPSVTETFGPRSDRLRDALALIAAWLLLVAPATGQVKAQAALARIDHLRDWMGLAREHKLGTVDDR
jgi:hypothetical protein